MKTTLYLLAFRLFILPAMAQTTTMRMDTTLTGHVYSSVKDPRYDTGVHKVSPLLDGHKCKICLEQGLKSKLYPGPSTMTLLACPGYYDEDGHWVQPRCNTTTTQYHCSNGHSYTEQSK